MKKQDCYFLKAFALLLTAIFSPLLAHPEMIPGNFGDIYSYHYPLRHLIASTLQEGRLPLWNPYIFAGTPLAANPQSVLFYPLAALHYFLPLSWALSLDAFLHVLLAGLGAQLLLRKWKLDSAGAWILSISYALSPFVVYRISQGIPTHLAALAWAPWIWLAAQGESPLWLGLTLALQILSGHPQFSIINFSALTLYILLTRPAKLRFLCKACLLTLPLAAVQVLPTVEYLRHSVRSIWDPSLATGYSLLPSYLQTFLYPNILGNPRQAGFQLFPSEFFEMLTNYIGLIPLIFAAVGLCRTKTIRCFFPAYALWAMAALGLFFALGSNNPLYPYIQRLEFGSLRTPSRFSFMILWAMWLAAAFGWKRMRPMMPPLLAGSLALAAALDMTFWSAPWVYAQDPAKFIAPNQAMVHVLRQGPFPGRFATDPDNPTPDKSMQYRLYNATGYEAFYPAAIALYTARSEKTASADGSRTYIRDWLTPEMSKLGVRYYVSPWLLRGRRPVFKQGGTLIYENPRARPLVQTADAWQILDPEHWLIQTNKPLPVLLSQAMYPGWKAWGNGKRLPLSLEDGLFPVIPNPTASAGSPGIIHFRFLPGIWFLGMMITLLSLTAAGLFLLRFVLRRT